MKVGIFQETHDEYHQRGLVASKSGLDQVARSPAHFKAWVESTEERKTPALVIGGALHCALHEPDDLAKRYVVQPDFGDRRKTVAKTAHAAWMRDVAPGRTIITADQWNTAVCVAQAVREHPLAKRILADPDAEHETTVRWEDDGVPCKARLDLLSRKRRMVLDVKTTEDASEAGWIRSSTNYGYHRQEAFYRQGLAANEVEIDHFVFLAVEKSAPNCIAMYTFDAAAQSMGRASIMRDVARFRECLASGVWPGYPATIQRVTLPPWAA